MAKDAIFPTNFNIWREASDSDIWATTEFRSYGGSRISVVKYHLKEFKLPLGYLDADEIILLKGFINYVQGKHHSFYLVDPFNTITDTEFTGDGVTTEFQLSRSYDNLYVEYPVFPTGITGGYGIDGWICEELQGYGVPIQYPLDVYVDGVLLTEGYYLSTDGKLCFWGAPADGAVITITEWKMCYQAHFKDDPVRTLFIYNGWKTDLFIETEVL